MPNGHMNRCGICGCHKDNPCTCENGNPCFFVTQAGDICSKCARGRKVMIKKNHYLRESKRQPKKSERKAVPA